MNVGLTCAGFRGKGEFFRFGNKDSMAALGMLVASEPYRKYPNLRQDKMALDKSSLDSRYRVTLRVGLGVWQRRPISVYI